MSESLLATPATPNPEAPVTPPVEAGSSPAPATPEQPAVVEPPAPLAPETYEFANPEGLPEGTEVGSKIHEVYAEASRELDLPQDKAQGLFSKTMGALHEHITAEQARQNDEWIAATRADPEIGGAKLDENIGIAKKAMKEFGSEALGELFNGDIGNHPEITRFLVKVGKALSEDGFVGTGKGASVASNDINAIAAKLYPNS